MTANGEQLFDADPQRQRLLRNKLGGLLTWKKPALTQTIGPFDPAAFDPFDSRRMKLIGASVDKLASYTDDQIAIILAPGGRDTTDAKDWQNFLSDEIGSLLRRIPDWYIGGFGHPDHAADFAYWAKMSRFHLSELTSLSVGINPKDFGWDQLSRLTTSKERGRFCPALEFLVQRYEQLYRKFGRLGRDAEVSPREFIDWAEQVEFEVHPGILEPLNRFHPARPPAGAAASPRRQDKREVDSIAQLFTAMAIEQFGYDPRQTRSPATKEIRDLAASLGMSITDDTILKYLRIGAKFISPDWTPHER